MVFRAKPIAKSQLRFQTDWSLNGPPGQLWQMESTLMQASVKCSCRGMKKTSHKFHKEELTIIVSFSGDFCRHRIQAWKSPTNEVSSTYVHPCHPWLQTAGNGFNADMFHISHKHFCLSFQGINWSCKLLFCYLLSWWPYQPVMTTSEWLVLLHQLVPVSYTPCNLHPVCGGPIPLHPSCLCFCSYWRSKQGKSFFFFSLSRSTALASTIYSSNNNLDCW